VTRDVVPFVLPGPAADRETAAGWASWRQRRHGFVAAPRLSVRQYAALSPRRRSLYDLHRSATHANLAFQETPMGAAVSALLWSRLQGNALKHGPATRAGVMVTGAGYQGKTETVCDVAAAFEDQWLELNDQVNPQAVAGTRDLWATVVYVQTPVTATPKSVCEAILNFYGALHPRKTLAQLVSDVRTSLYEHGTKVLILDDVSRLRLHREADRDALDLLRSLMSMHVTLVLIGVGGALPRPGGQHRHVHRQHGWYGSGGHPDSTPLRRGRARPVPLRHTGRHRRLGGAPGRAGGPTAVAARPAGDARRRGDA
jgi:hypothetical protein